MPISDILLDVEGTTSSIDFVHRVLFPYAKQRIGAFLQENHQDAKVSELLDGLRKTLQAEEKPYDTLTDLIAALLGFIEEDRKDTTLKALQGMIWKEGFEAGTYKSHVYPEVPEHMNQWVETGVRLSIYSSGSISAQKLFFSHTEFGNLLPLISHHFDTTTGHKRESESYKKIAQALQKIPTDILFLSDIEAELDAALDVGFQTCQLVRPGTVGGSRHRQASDFNQVQTEFFSQSDN